jgi:2-polyprenyl-3-methyl-5-hydroxy-6-metoxy-1,4-benzoquinol methylase
MDATGKAYDRAALINWYNDKAPTYDSISFNQSADAYGGDLYRIEIVKRILAKHDVKTVLDVGCGTGEPMIALLDKGYDVVGFDVSPGMISVAKNKLLAKAVSPDRVSVADILDATTVNTYRAAFDCVVANGVLPYIEDEETAHQNLAEMIKPGGLFVSAYTNEIFNSFTFNLFTVSFFRENILPLVGDELDHDWLLERFKGLMTHPDEPKSFITGARNDIFVRHHNPLTIRDQLGKAGLTMADLYFYKFHIFPPLLKSSDEKISKIFNELSRKLELKYAQDWRGYFMASTFIIEAKKL